MLDRAEQAHPEHRALGLALELGLALAVRHAPVSEHVPAQAGHRRLPAKRHVRRAPLHAAAVDARRNIPRQKKAQ